MPRKSQIPIDARQQKAIKRRREYYEKNKIEICKQSAIRMRALRQNNSEYREKERKRDAVRRAQRRKDQIYRESERVQNTLSRALRRANPEYREKERKREALRKAACHKKPEEPKCVTSPGLRPAENPQSLQENGNGNGNINTDQ